MKAIILFCALVFCTTPALAQSPEAPYGIQVTAFFSEDPQDEALEQAIIATVKQLLDQRGIPEAGTEQTVLLVDARWVPERQEVVLSATKMQALPRAVLDVGASEEVFYLSLAGAERPANLTSEGEKIRQYVSREWLGQHHLVVGQRLLVFPRARLEAELEALVDALVGR